MSAEAYLKEFERWEKEQMEKMANRKKQQWSMINKTKDTLSKYIGEAMNLENTKDNSLNNTQEYIRPVKDMFPSENQEKENETPNIIPHKNIKDTHFPSKNQEQNSSFDDHPPSVTLHKNTKGFCSESQEKAKDMSNAISQKSINERETSDLMPATGIKDMYPSFGNQENDIYDVTPHKNIKEIHPYENQEKEKEITNVHSHEDRKDKHSSKESEKKNEIPNTIPCKNTKKLVHEFEIDKLPVSNKIDKITGDRRIAFEKMIEDQLKMEREINKMENEVHNVHREKFPFLKKRTGLQRFSPTVTGRRCCAEQKNEPKTTGNLLKKSTSQPINKQNAKSSVTTKRVVNRERASLPTATKANKSADKPKTDSNAKENLNKKTRSTNKTVDDKSKETTSFNNKYKEQNLENDGLEGIKNTSFDSETSIMIRDFLRDEAARKDRIPEAIIDNAEPVTIDSLNDLDLEAYKSDLQRRLAYYEEELKSVKNSTNAKSNEEKLIVHNSKNDKVDSNYSALNKDLEFQAQGYHNEEQEEIASFSADSDVITVQKTILVEKFQELEKEIHFYKTQNEILGKLQIQRNNELKEIQKNKEEFEAFKLIEINKLHRELEEKNKRLMREKETFDHYQKLRHSMPSQNDAEEFDKLKQKFKNLQEEMKMKKSKYTTEIKRLKQLLSSTERERDRYKLELEKLQQNQKDVLSKAVMKCKQVRSEKPKSDESSENEDNEFNPEFQQLKDDLHSCLQSFDVTEDNEKNPIAFHSRSKITNKCNDGATYKEYNFGSRVERIYSNGDKEVFFQNGSRKYIVSDQSYKKFTHNNGDIEEVFSDGRTVYTFNGTGVKEIHFPSGLQIFDFPGSHIEKKFPTGVQEILYPNNSSCIIYPNGTQEIRSNDGKIITKFNDGSTAVVLPSGEKQVHTSDYVRHDYSDGRTKIVYKSGRCEIRYPNGRLKIQDNDGNVLFDNILEQ